MAKVTEDILLRFGPRSGKLPSVAIPGMYPLIYMDKENSTLCADCATESFLNPDEIDHFRPVEYDTYLEGPAIHCDQCSVEIGSAYGVPDADDPDLGPVDTYEIVVSNIGTAFTVDDGTSPGTSGDRRQQIAFEMFESYVDDSKLPHGRASGESVVLMKNGEPIEEYIPDDENEDD
jgi:hypothetical protein